jgi:hypothetical protein
MPRKHTIYDSAIDQVINIPFTRSEETAWDQKEKQDQQRAEQVATQQTATAERKASAIRKLGALGLSPLEIQALLPE